MTSENIEQVEKDALYEYHKAKRNYGLVRVRIEQIADALESLARGLRAHPERVTPTPEIDGPDYRDGINLLAKREELVNLCKELAELKYRLKNAEERKAFLWV